MTIAQAIALTALGWFLSSAASRELGKFHILTPLSWSLLVGIGMVMLYAGPILVLIGIAK